MQAASAHRRHYRNEMTVQLCPEMAMEHRAEGSVCRRQDLDFINYPPLHSAQFSHIQETCTGRAAQATGSRTEAVHSLEGLRGCCRPTGRSPSNHAPKKAEDLQRGERAWGRGEEARKASQKRQWLIFREVYGTAG